jgi:hypothetical protein
MASTCETSAIDKKKETDQKKNNIAEDVKNVATSFPVKCFNFITSLSMIIFYILMTLVSGSFILYMCKVATANVLPTEIECSPYSSVPPIITPIDVDVDINKINGQFYSTKINFPFNKSDDPDVEKIAMYNRSNFILDWIKKQKDVYNSWGIKMYFLSVIEGLFQKNYSIINWLFHFMNQHFYEFLIVLFGPSLFLFAIPIITIYTFFYSIYLWGAKFFWLFKENTNTQAGHLPKWQDVTFMNPINFCISCVVAFWLLAILIVTYIFGFPIISAFKSLIFIICIASAFLMKSMISDGENIKQLYGVGKTFTDLLFSKMHYIMILISIQMVMLTFAYFGVAPGVFSMIACVILFIGLVGNKIYSRQIPKDSTPGLTSEEFEQAFKSCPKILTNNKMTWVGRVFGQSGGEKNLINEIKRLCKEIKK